MAVTTHDLDLAVAHAAEETGASPTAVCSGLRLAIPVLRELNAKRFILLRVVSAGLIAALSLYVELRCPQR